MQKSVNYLLFLFFEEFDEFVCLFVFCCFLRMFWLDGIIEDVILNVVLFFFVDFFSRVCCCFLSLSSLKITITESLNRRISFVFFQCNNLFFFRHSLIIFFFLSIWNLFLFVWALRWYVDTQKDKERLRDPIDEIVPK